MPKQKLTSDDFDSYCRLREALDAFRDSALVQYTLFKTLPAREKFSADVEESVKTFQNEFIKTDDNKVAWEKDDDKAFLTALANSKAGCPPGFVEVDGMCVRIP